MTDSILVSREFLEDLADYKKRRCTMGEYSFMAKDILMRHDTRAQPASEPKPAPFCWYVGWRDDNSEYEFTTSASRAEKLGQDIDFRVTELFARPAPAGVVPDKYDEVLTPFMAMMRAELHANAAKGDRPGWLGMTAELGDRIIENTADVANMAMMLADICGALGVAQLSPMAKVAAMMDVKSQQEWAKHPSNPVAKLNCAPK